MAPVDLERRNPRARHWPTMRRDVAIVLWASFLVACFATMVFFALLDPTLLAQDASPPWWLADRMTGYACGFFFFWAMCAVASFTTVFMLNTQPHRDGA